MQLTYSLNTHFSVLSPNTMMHLSHFGTSLEFCHGRKSVLVFTIIREQLQLDNSNLADKS